MSEYPKLLFRGGQEITVQSASEAAARMAEGFEDPHAPRVEPEPEPVEAIEPEADVEGPTFGSAHEPHRDPPRRGRKKR